MQSDSNNEFQTENADIDDKIRSEDLNPIG